MSEKIVRELTERERAVLEKHAMRVERAQRETMRARQVLQDLCNLLAEEGQTVNIERGIILDPENPDGDEG